MRQVLNTTMNTFGHIRVALVLIMVLIAPGLVGAQHRSVIFDNVERTITGKEPGWILNKQPNPDPQYRVTMHQWVRSGNEINIWMIDEQSVEAAARVFYEMATSGRAYPQLPIGDKCYVLTSSASGMTLLMRKGNLVARMSSYDSLSGPSAPHDDLLRFANHIAAAVPSGPVTLTNSREHTSSAESHYREGVDYLKAGDKTKAIEAFREAIRLRPEWTDAHYQLGLVYYETGEYKAAAKAFEEALRLQPEFFDALIALGKTYQHLALHVRAVEVLQQAVLMRADNIDARTALGTALILAAQPKDAVAVLREAARLAPESALIYASLGQAYRLSGNFDEALIALQQALRLSPDDPLTHYNLGLTYTELGLQGDALKAYKRAIALKADYAEAHYNLGLLYVAIGERSFAQAEYETLKRLNSNFADALLQRIR
jgi:tetratricopeptide (TPR) repeat protein